MPLDARESGEKQVREYRLKSLFEDLPIQVREIVAPHANKLVIYAHGSFDEMDGHYGFYTRLFSQLADDNIASTVQLNTARKPCYTNGTYDGVIDAFKGKTLLQEYSDVHQVITTAIQRLPELVEDPKTAEIILVGLSLGGTLMTLNAYQYPQVSKLLILSSGCRTQNKGLPMMDTYPSADIIKNCAAAFRGTVMHVSPGRDQVVPNAFQDELYQSFQPESRMRTVVDGTDHVYTGKKDELAKLITDFIGH